MLACVNSYIKSKTENLNHYKKVSYNICALQNQKVCDSISFGGAMEDIKYPFYYQYLNKNIPDADKTDIEFLKSVDDLLNLEKIECTEEQVHNKSVLMSEKFAKLIETLPESEVAPKKYNEKLQLVFTSIVEAIDKVKTKNVSVELNKIFDMFMDTFSDEDSVKSALNTYCNDESLINKTVFRDVLRNICKRL